MTKKTISLRIDEDILKRLDKHIKAVGGSVSTVIETLLRNTVDMLDASNGERKQIRKKFSDDVERMDKSLDKLKILTGGSD